MKRLRQEERERGCMRRSKNEAQREGANKDAAQCEGGAARCGAIAQHLLRAVGFELVVVERQYHGEYEEDGDKEEDEKVENRRESVASQHLVTGTPRAERTGRIHEVWVVLLSK